MDKIIKLICLAFVMLTIAISASGCNTFEGVGKDIERTGENIQDAAD